MVRLKAKVENPEKIIVPMFQFHNGSIKGLTSLKPNFWHKRFNSTMVRLKVKNADHKIYGCRRFQFHNGSIKGNNKREHQVLPGKFQFHNGSIKG